MLLQNSDKHILVYRRVLPWAAVIGIAGNTYLASAAWFFDMSLPDTSSVASSLSWVIMELSLFALSMAYLAGLVILYQKPPWRKRLEHLAPVGIDQLFATERHHRISVLRCGVQSAGQSRGTFLRDSQYRGVWLSDGDQPVVATEIPIRTNGVGVALPYVREEAAVQACVSRYDMTALFFDCCHTV